MKRNLILMFFLSANVFLFAQKTYKLSFDKKDFSFNINGNILSINPLNNDFSFLGDSLSPALPYFTYNILRPGNSLTNDFEIEVKKERMYTDILIRSNPKNIPVSLMNVSSTITIARSSVLAPVSFVGNNTLKGYSFATFNVTPFIYDATSGELYFISEISITLKEGSKRAINQFRTETGTSKIQQMIINPDELSTFYPAATKSIFSSNEIIEYLVVTTEELKDAFLPLIHWKTQKGVRAKIVTLESIYSNYAGETNQLKIKRCFQDYYQNYGLKWVLLGGDNTIVPTQDCFIRVANNTDLTPADLFYACFDNTFNWDANSNGLIGELNDNIDMYPEIYVSRLPIRTAGHVRSFWGKLLKYEKEPHSSGYIKSMLLSGKQLAITWNEQSDAHQRSEFMYTQYIAPYWNGNKSYFYDTGSSMTGGADYNLTAGNLQNQINQGYHFLHTATHGSETTWQMETGSSYSTINASAQSNTDATIIATTACYSNGFDNMADPCLSEVFIRNPRSCLAYLGSSRSAWAFNDKTVSLGPSFKYNAYFFKNLFAGIPSSDPYKFGTAVALAKQQMAGASNDYNPERWLQFALNPVGDPEMDIYTETPSTFSNVTVTQNGTTVTVNTGGISNCKIVLCSKEDYGESYFSVAKDVSSYTFTGVNVPCSIGIMKHNYIPYFFNEDILIQNKTFTGKNVLVGKNIKIGKNVKPNATQGNVKISNGANVTVDAENSVLLDAGFKCELGGTLKIK